MIEKYQKLQNKPIRVEVMLLEVELQKLLDRNSPQDDEAIKFLFSRCNRLWHKIKSR